MKSFFGCFLTMAAWTVHAALPDVPPLPGKTVVIHDAGGVSIARLFESLRPGNEPQIRPQPPISPMTIPVFPVVSTKVKPGRLGGPMRGKLKGGPTFPLCILGDDPLSHQWIAVNLAHLQQMHAACLVVSVADEGRFKRLAAAMPGIPLTPGSFDALAEATGIPVWPVLVAPDGLVSQ